MARASKPRSVVVAEGTDERLTDLEHLIGELAPVVRGAMRELETRLDKIEAGRDNDRWRLDRAAGQATEAHARLDVYDAMYLAIGGLLFGYAVFLVVRVYRDA